MTTETDHHAEAENASDTLGLIGLGRIGNPVASTLKRAGFNVIATSRSTAARASAEAAGIPTVDTPADLAARVRIILISVFDTTALENVIRGTSGLLGGLEPGTTVVDLGTSAIAETTKLAQAIEDAGGEYIDAPVSGGTRGAAAGELTLFIGAKTDVLARVRLVLDALGRVNHMGDVGAGQSTKAINQLILGQTLVAVAEGLSLARTLGFDPARVREALIGGFSESRVLLEHGQRMVEDNFDPGGSIAVFSKDLGLVRELVQQQGLELPGFLTVYTQYEQAINDGLVELDQAAVVKIYP